VVDHINKGIQTGVFTAWGAMVVGRARDDAETADPVCRGGTFENPGRGGNAVFVGAIAHRSTAARGDGFGDCLAIIHEGEVV
jgi:hypothetical protein